MKNFAETLNIFNIYSFKLNHIRQLKKVLI